jgi:hypothetical protein
LLMSGFKTPFPSSQQSINALYLVKTDRNGRLEWEKSYPSMVNVQNPKSVASAENGRYLVVGTLINNAPAAQIFALQIDENGNQVALKLHGNSSQRNVFNAITMAQDGNYVVLSMEYPATQGLAAGNFQIHKLNNIGALIWTQKYMNFQSVSMLTRGLALTNDNGFLITTDSVFSTNGTSYSAAGVVVKITESGQYQWSKTRAYDYTNNFLLNDGNILSGNGGQIAVSNQRGELIWRKNLFVDLFPNTQQSAGGTVVKTMDNNGVFISTMQAPFSAVVIAKLDPQGRFLWTQDNVVTGTNIPYISHAVPNLTDTCFIAAGRNSTNPAAQGKAWIGQFGNCGFVSSKELADNKLTINVLHHPMVYESLISIKNAPLSISGHFQLSDISGRLVMQNKFTENSFYFQRQNLSAGLYLLTIKTDDGKMGTVKIVVQ